jgi:hypothetical protein
MVSFWTILVLIYGNSDDELFESKIIFPSLEACRASVEWIYEPIYENYSDTRATCYETDDPSSIVRPRPRP